MPTLTINTDTITGPLPYNGQSTIETVVLNTLWAVIGDSYAKQFNSTDFNDAAADYLAAVLEGRGVGMAKQIRTHAAGLLAAGVAAPGGKLVACSQAHVDNLATAAALTAAQIGALSLAAVDGTRWPVNTPARATTLRNAMTARITAVNGARDAAITAFQALTAEEKRAFQFGSIVWP
jgi:hypothetical protein